MKLIHTVRLNVELLIALARVAQWIERWTVNVN